jgi:hypothetical protein
MVSQTKRLALVLMALALAALACSLPSSANSTATEPVSPEPDSQGTEADNVRSSGAPSVTPEFPYSGQGETLAMIQQVESGNHRILLLDPYGFGFRDIRLPEDAILPNQPEVGLSPDGLYYAYFTGSTNTGDLTLVLYGVDNSRVLTQVPLLSSDYPDNFQTLADQFLESDSIPTELAWADPDEIPFELQNAFEFGIESLAWSPTGRYLAFCGQMDGPSSDLYVLDSQTLRVTRLTTGSGMMQRLSWSPNGRWIMHASAFYVGAGSSVTNHVASRDGANVISFPPDQGLIEGVWLTSNLFTVNQSANGPGSHQLMVLDVREGNVTTIFEGAFQSYAFDPGTNTILLQSYPFYDTDPDQGLYRIEASRPYEATLIEAPTVFALTSIGLDDYPFSAILEEGGMVLISSDGSMHIISDQSWYPFPAPTANLLALSYFQADAGLWIYDVDLDQRTNVHSGSVSRVEWRPDSGALFYISGRELHIYYLDSGIDNVIYDWPGTSVTSTRFAWVNLP